MKQYFPCDSAYVKNQLEKQQVADNKRAQERFNMVMNASICTVLYVMIIWIAIHYFL